MIRTTGKSTRIILLGEVLTSENTVGLTAGVALWCAICQISGKHVTDNYHLHQKFVQTL